MLDHPQNHPIQLSAETAPSLHNLSQHLTVFEINICSLHQLASLVP